MFINNPVLVSFPLPLDIEVLFHSRLPHLLFLPAPGCAFEVYSIFPTKIKSRGRSGLSRHVFQHPVFPWDLPVISDGATFFFLISRRYQPTPLPCLPLRFFTCAFNCPIPFLFTGRRSTLDQGRTLIASSYRDSLHSSLPFPRGSSMSVRLLRGAALQYGAHRPSFRRYPSY